MEWLYGEDLEDLEIKNPELSEKVERYLHGDCHEWALNNYKDGDKFLALVENREGIKTLCLMHCCLLRDNNYVDVRGITDELEDVLDGFDYGWFDGIEFETAKEFKKFLKKIKVL